MHWVGRDKKNRCCLNYLQITALDLDHSDFVTSFVITNEDLFKPRRIVFNGTLFFHTSSSGPSEHMKMVGICPNQILPRTYLKVLYFFENIL